MKYVFDIDGTICNHTSKESPSYENGMPEVERINKINKLFDNGHQIIFHTARGMGTFKNDGKKAHEKYYDLTFKQRVKFQADVQNYVDMAISSTCNLPKWGSDRNNEETLKKNSKLLF